MMAKNPKKRLGFKGVQEIKDHPYFADIDWNKLKSKMITPPFIPDLKGQFDTKYIDKEFLARSHKDKSRF